MISRSSKSGVLSSPARQWLAALALSGVLCILAILVILGAVGSVYIENNPVAAFEEDLGYGLLMVCTLIVSAIAALPVWVVLTGLIGRYFARKFG